MLEPPLFGMSWLIRGSCSNRVGLAQIMAMVCALLASGCFA